MKRMFALPCVLALSLLLFSIASLAAPPPDACTKACEEDAYQFLILCINAGGGEECLQAAADSYARCAAKCPID